MDGFGLPNIRVASADQNVTINSTRNEVWPPYLARKLKHSNRANKIFFFFPLSDHNHQVDYFCHSWCVLPCLCCHYSPNVILCGWLGSKHQLTNCCHNPPKSDMNYRIVIVRTDVNACDCTRGCTDTRKRGCSESWLWEKIPCRTGESNLRQGRNGTRSDALTNWATSPPQTWPLRIESSEILLFGLPNFFFSYGAVWFPIVLSIRKNRWAKENEIAYIADNE